MRFIDQGGRRLLFETALYAMAKGIPGACGLLSVVLFVRIIGVEQYGLFAIVFASVNMWASFSGGWFYQGVLRYYSSWNVAGSELDGFFWRGFRYCIVIFVSSYISHTLIFERAAHLHQSIAGLLLGVVLIGQTIAVSIWQSELQPRVVLYAETVRSLATLGVSLLVAYAISATANALIIGAAIGYLCSLLVRRQPRKAAVEDGKAIVGPALLRTWNYGWPLSFWFLVQLSFPWLDRMMIDTRFGLHETGVYASLSDVLTRCFTLFIYPLTIAVHPRMAALWNQGRRREAQRLQSTALVFGVGVALAIIFAIWIETVQIARILLPSEFDGSAMRRPELLVLLAVGGAIWQLAMLAHKLLEMQGRTVVMLWAICGALAIKVLMNFYALPRFGVVGAAYGTVGSGLAYAFVVLIISRRKKGANE